MYSNSPYVVLYQSDCQSQRTRQVENSTQSKFFKYYSSSEYSNVRASSKQRNKKCFCGSGLKYKKCCGK